MGKQYKKLAEIIMTVKNNYMSFKPYLWIHKNAMVSTNQKVLVSICVNELAKFYEIELSGI